MAVNKNNVKIHVEHLEKTFGKIEVLKDISNDIYEGEVVVVIGPSGSGKSTFLRCLNRLEQPTGGTIIVDGFDISDKKVNINKVRENIGMVFQHFNLFNNLNVLQNLMLAPVDVKKMTKEEAKEKALKMLDRVGLSDKADAFPSQLSGGQKQRVAIARALATKPRVLLCDEATSALDPATTDSILALIKDINVQLGITAVVITHEMSVIEKICSHVAIISKGVIVEQGLVEDVFFHPRTEAARRLVLPEALRRLPQPNLYRLIFNGRSSFEPVIANMVLECGCPVNIMYADTRDINGVAFGQMVLQLPEREESRARIMAFAEAHSIMLEEMKHV